MDWRCIGNRLRDGFPGGRRDARQLATPLVFLLAADECSTLDKDAYSRLLNVSNIHNTGKMQGVLPAHGGMRVRFAGKFNATLDLVQWLKATILGFIFEDPDAERYRRTGLLHH